MMTLERLKELKEKASAEMRYPRHSHTSTVEMLECPECFAYQQQLAEVIAWHRGCMEYVDELLKAEREPKPPQHLFEVRIAIGGDDWIFIRRAAREIADYIEERNQDHCGTSSGSTNGCYSIDIATFRKELEEWRHSLASLSEKEKP